MAAPQPTRSILFVCVANSFRSQMAEAVARQVGGDRWEVWSAGSAPSGRVHPMAIQLMAELGLDLATHQSKGLEELPRREWDYVVTMGCGDACPSVRARHRIDWNVPDPAALPLDEARRLRDQLVQSVRSLMADGHLDKS